MTKIIHPQEIAVWYILPTLRREISMSMNKEGLTQAEIAGLLGVSEAAISFYLSNKRASKINIGKSLKKLIEETSKRIIKNKDSITEIQKLMKNKEIKKLSCKIHKKIGRRSSCSVCYG